MKVYDVVFNKGVDYGNFSVMAENVEEAYAKAEKFLSNLTAREIKAVAGEGWVLFGLEERLVVNGIIIH